MMYAFCCGLVPWGTVRVFPRRTMDDCWALPYTQEDKTGCKIFEPSGDFGTYLGVYYASSWGIAIDSWLQSQLFAAGSRTHCSGSVCLTLPQQ